MDGEPKDLTTRVLVEIRDELRGHTRILDEHTRLLTDHDVQLREHGGRIGGVESAVARLAGSVEQQGVTLRQILRAVEAGNERRDAGFQDHERRIVRLESRTGLDR